MDLHQLAKMSEADIASWVRGNTDKFSLISDSELESIRKLQLVFSVNCCLNHTHMIKR